MIERISSDDSQTSALDGTEWSTALEAYLSEELDRFVADTDAPPSDPQARLRDFAPVDDRRLVVGRVVTTGDMQPQKPTCMDGQTGDCWREQRTSGSKTYWVWVCECRPI